MYIITLDKINEVNTNAMQKIDEQYTKTMQNRQCKYIGEGSAKQGMNSPVNFF